MWRFIMHRKDDSTYPLEYDPVKNTLTRDGVPVPVPDDLPVQSMYGDNGGMALRIALGKKCNFHCAYCTQDKARQSFTELAPTLPAGKFVDGLISFAGDKGIGHVQFWGGEPLMYLDEIKKLHHAFEERNLTPDFYVSTNGSMMKGDAFRWLMDKGFFVSLSWDGAGQYLRGREIFDDPEIVANVRFMLDERPDAFQLAPVMTKATGSHYDYIRLAAEKIGRDDFRLSEAVLTMVETPEAMACALPVENMPEYPRRLHQDIIYGRIPQYTMPYNLALRFLHSLNSPVSVDNTRCFVNNRKVATIDRQGNVQVCQNLNADGRHAATGEPFGLGNIFEGNVRTPTLQALRERRRTRCLHCPVVAICKGGCPYMSREYEDYNCQANFHHLMPVMGLALAILTGDGLRAWEWAGPEPCPAQTAEEVKAINPVYSSKG